MPFEEELPLGGEALSLHDKIKQEQDLEAAETRKLAKLHKEYEQLRGLVDEDGGPGAARADEHR